MCTNDVFSHMKWPWTIDVAYENVILGLHKRLGPLETSDYFNVQFVTKNLWQFGIIP